ncbi:MAG: hypothetical protein JO189_26570 [Deltaproteobacteria bacterium]|nr:hypothetical protein [Deltaproteobacteria bacterium]
MAVSILAPAIWMRQMSRQNCFLCVIAYYFAALHCLPIVSRNFFGPKAGFLQGLCLWLIAGVLLSLPWLWGWTRSKEAILWRCPTVLLLSIIPPVGLIAWASPVTAAGLLFPATRFFGLALTLLLPALLIISAQRTVLIGTACVFICHACAGRPPLPPRKWETVDTRFGAIAHAPIDPIREYEAAETIQSRAVLSIARVIVFPEAVVSSWTETTDLFWQQTLAELSASGKTILVGATVPDVTANSQASAAQIGNYDFTETIAAIRSIRTDAAKPAPAMSFDSIPYRNAVLIRGVETGEFHQRIPVPIGMWRPFSGGGVPLNLFGRGTVRINHERAAIVICYEQLLPWPVLTSMLERPTLLLGVANDCWVKGTAIARLQAVSVRAWARLFQIPALLATNR